jgi:hypothetical protein
MCVSKTRAVHPYAGIENSPFSALSQPGCFSCVVVESVIQQRDAFVWWIIAVVRVCMAIDCTIFSFIVYTPLKLALLCLDMGELTGEIMIVHTAVTCTVRSNRNRRLDLSFDQIGCGISRCLPRMVAVLLASYECQACVSQQAA